MPEVCAPLGHSHRCLSSSSASTPCLFGAVSSQLSEAVVSRAVAGDRKRDASTATFTDEGWSAGLGVIDQPDERRPPTTSAWGRIRESQHQRVAAQPLLHSCPLPADASTMDQTNLAIPALRCRFQVGVDDIQNVARGETVKVDVVENLDHGGRLRVFGIPHDLPPDVRHLDTA